MKLDGETIKGARRAARLTQPELAKKAGWDQKTIQRAEAGKSISGQAARSIATAVGVPLQRLILEVGSSDGDMVYFERIQDGQVLLERLSEGHLFRQEIERTQGDASDLIKKLLALAEYAEIWSDIAAAGKFSAGQDVDQVLLELKKLGWEVLLAQQTVVYQGANDMQQISLKIQKAHAESGMFCAAAAAAAEPAILDDIIETARKNGVAEEMLPAIRSYYEMLGPDGPVVRAADGLGVRPEMLLQVITAVELRTPVVGRAQALAEEAERLQVDKERLSEAVMTILFALPMPPTSPETAH
jgi:transcriptional regulator with XRE-family HTH domain